LGGVEIDFRGSTGGRTRSQGSVNLAKPVFARARPRRGPGQELGSKRAQEAQLHFVDGSYSLARPKTARAEGSQQNWKLHRMKDISDHNTIASQACMPIKKMLPVCPFSSNYDDKHD